MHYFSFSFLLPMVQISRGSDCSPMGCNLMMSHLRTPPSHLSQPSPGSHPPTNHRGSNNLSHQSLGALPIAPLNSPRPPTPSRFTRGSRCAFSLSLCSPSLHCPLPHLLCWNKEPSRYLTASDFWLVEELAACKDLVCVKTNIVYCAAHCSSLTVCPLLRLGFRSW